MVLILIFAEVLGLYGSVLPRSFLLFLNQANHTAYMLSASQAYCGTYHEFTSERGSAVYITATAEFQRP